MTHTVAHFPKILDDETLSSLILRLARRHSATAHELCKLLWPNIEFWTRDIDGTISDASLRTLSVSTGIPYTELRQATLKDLSVAFGSDASMQGCVPGILPIGIYHRVRRRYGQQYCHECLAQNPPYLRRVWRMEFAICCPEHGVMLNDCCPSCGAPFIPHRKLALIQRQCHHCGASLCEAVKKQAPDMAVALYLTIFAKLRQVPGAVAHYGIELPRPPYPQLADVDPLEFISGVRRLCRLATCEAMSESDRRTRSTSFWAFQRVEPRANAMSIVARWLDGWPNTWLDWVATKGLTKCQLNWGYGPFPSWISTQVSRIPDSGFPLQPNRAKPLTRLSVLRRRFTVRKDYREARAALLLRRATLRDMR